MMMMMMITNTITDSVCIPLGPGVFLFLWMFPEIDGTVRPWILQEILEKKIHAKSHVWRFPLEPLGVIWENLQVLKHPNSYLWGKKVPCFKCFSFGVWNIPKVGECHAEIQDGSIISSETFFCPHLCQKFLYIVGFSLPEIPPLLASGPNDAKTKTWCLRWSCCCLSIPKKLWCSTRGLDNPLFPVLSTDFAVDFWGTSFWEHFDSWNGMI